MSKLNIIADVEAFFCCAERGEFEINSKGKDRRAPHALYGLNPLIIPIKGFYTRSMRVCMCVYTYLDYKSQSQTENDSGGRSRERDMASFVDPFNDRLVAGAQADQ